MHGLPPERGSTIAVLSAGLLVLIALTAALTILVFRPPNRARFQVSELQAVTCPSGVHTPVCYNAPVTNVGSIASPMQCEIQPGPGTQAMFPTDMGTYVSPNQVRPGESLIMLIKVDVPEGGTVTRPTVSCSPV